MENINEKAINIAIEEAKVNLENNYQNGGPFGAVIVKDGKIISRAHNTVIESMDATAHAEVNAIRMASKILNTHDLSDCVLYASSEPCPMCLSAIIWANIKEVHYANSAKEAEEIGFRDDMIYEYIRGNNDLIKMNHIPNKNAKEVFNTFKELENKKMY